MTSHRVLVVEDSRTQAQLLRLILEAEGFAVQVATDGSAALALLETVRFDIVVSDVLMPGVDGFELCRRIKAEPAWGAMPVVLVTTLLDPLEIVRALEVGADGFVRKPYDADALVQRLRSVLAEGPQASADGVQAVFNGRTIQVRANRAQVLRLLLGTFEEVVRSNALLLEREEQLSQAKKELEEAARMKDIFFATLSHELRTPLTAIVGWVHILKQGQRDPGLIQRAVDTIERNLNVQNRLIADLLDVSRIVSGKLDLEMSPVDLPSIVGASVESARPMAHAAGVELHLAVSPLSAAVSGDPARLQQVVGNLLGNSLKFTPRGGRVDVRLDEQGNDAVISVSDTGSGIRADVLPFVFERFRQSSVQDTRAGGLGLGLAIVKHIIEGHGGTVTAASDGAGRGATFTLTLPVTAEVVAAPASTSSTTPLAGVRVLVADDQEDSRELILFLLGQQGALVTGAASAAEAYAAIKDDPPDVLLSDIEMPDETGYAFIGRVRALPPEDGGTIPAAAMTAHGSRDDRERAIAAGFHRHLPKPFQPADLFAMVGSLAGRQADR